MSVTLISSPEQVVQASPSEISRWNAVWHPNIFRLQRRDYNILVGDFDVNPGSGGDTLIRIRNVELTELEIGMDIFYSYGTLADTIGIEDVYISGGDTFIVVDRGSVFFPAPSDPGYINLVDTRSFYMIEVKVLKYDAVSGTEVTDAYQQFRPSNNAGDIKADIQCTLQTMLSIDNSFDYSTTNQLAKEFGRGYTIQLREYWKEAGYTSFSAPTNNVFGVVNAVKQVGDTWGQNLAEFVMYTPAGSNPQTNTFGKFLTLFEDPRYFVDYPFDLSYIHNRLISDLTIIKVEIKLDINGNSLGTTQTTLSTTVSNQTQYAGVMRMMLQGGYASNVYSVNVSLYANSFAIGNQISEGKNVIVDQSCYKNPEYLRWYNAQGSFDYWLFYGDQEHSMITSEESTFERHIEDLETADARRQTLKKKIETQINLGAEQLSLEQMQGIKGILSSTKVYRYLGLDSNDDPKWQVVLVNVGTFLVDKTDATKYELSFNIMPPETFIQQQ
jgi:hypothetical protein